MHAPVPPGPVEPLRAPGRAWWASGPRWPGAAELRADLRSALGVAGVLLVCGLPAGLLWWALAPRARFEVTGDGPVPIGRPSAELLVADDGVFTLVLAGLGLLAGVLAWRLRRRRGVAVLLALAVGTLLAAVLAWQLGQLLGPPPTQEQLADVGAAVTTGLRLNSPAALAIGPFCAVLAYLLAALLAATEDLGRPDALPAAAAPPLPGGVAPEASAREDARFS
ncbi:DUF2567 domain-containing protein [Geodermatophilus sp. SYSU D00708]